MSEPTDAEGQRPELDRFLRRDDARSERRSRDVESGGRIDKTEQPACKNAPHTSDMVRRREVGTTRLSPDHRGVPPAPWVATGSSAATSGPRGQPLRDRNPRVTCPFDGELRLVADKHYRARPALACFPRRDELPAARDAGESSRATGPPSAQVAAVERDDAIPGDRRRIVRAAGSAPSKREPAPARRAEGRMRATGPGTPAAAALRGARRRPLRSRERPAPRVRR